jgi:Recombination endonuclease VII
MPYADPEKRKQYHNNYYRGWRKRNKDKSRAIDKKSKDAHRQQIAEKNAANYNSEERWILHLKNKFKMKPEQYNEKLLEQGGVCAICGKVSTKKLHVDHDHKCCSGDKLCGKCNRGLLCYRCNVGLGFFQDDRYSLSKAIEYLTKHQSKENVEI